ncbi:hypothetical protein [Leptospira santarosai]|uniref:hypothetical protein n=1 Tax=Leptospira santarosai TaxID=28183 RepID=UPI000248A176|nr:hypothetical protein LEP1GSC040_1787 [Leptospira santarosai str. 2000030832]
METNLLNSRLLKEMEKYNTDLKKIKDYLKQGADPIANPENSVAETIGTILHCTLP